MSSKFLPGISYGGIEVPGLEREVHKARLGAVQLKLSCIKLVEIGVELAATAVVKEIFKLAHASCLTHYCSALLSLL